jgi:hypothetical protein
MHLFSKRSLLETAFGLACSVTGIKSSLFSHFSLLSNLPSRLANSQKIDAGSVHVFWTSEVFIKAIFSPKFSTAQLMFAEERTTQKRNQRFHGLFCSSKNTKCTYRRRLQNVKPPSQWTFRGLRNLIKTTTLPLCTPEQNSGEILRSPGNIRVRFPWVVSASLENYKIPPSVKAIFSSTIVSLFPKNPESTLHVCAVETTKDRVHVSFLKRT